MLRPKLWLHLGIQNLSCEKKGCAHCGEGGFTDEYRMYNVREPGHCLCGMLTMGARGQFCLLQEKGTRGEPAWHSSALVRHGNLASFPSWVFLRRWSYWTPRECMLWLLSNLHSFLGKITRANRSFSKKSVKNPNFFSPLPFQIWY